TDCQAAAVRDICVGSERHPRSRAGRKRIACNSANNAANVMPTNRNGKATSQPIGQRIKASSASGQPRINRKHHATKPMKAYMFTLVATCPERLPCNKAEPSATGARRTRENPDEAGNGATKALVAAC